MDEQGLHVEVEVGNPTTLIRVSGELDHASTPEFHECTSRLPPDCVPVMDASGLTFVDSAGLQALIVLKERHSALTIHAAPAQLTRLLNITGLDELFGQGGV